MMAGINKMLYCKVPFAFPGGTSSSFLLFKDVPTFPQENELKKTEIKD